MKQFNNQSLVSVIMNCYNGETYLQQSIESVLAQTYKNWELIFWDNRSEDNSKKIFKNYNDDRLKYYLASKHTILYEARNEAIKKSSGEFIAFLDTDDFWEKDKLELQIPLFKEVKVGVVYGNTFVVNENLNIKKVLIKGKKPRGFILNNLLKDYCTALGTLVIRKSFLNNIDSAFDGSYHIIGDFDLMIRMSTKYQFECVEKPISSWRTHGKNESLLKKKTQIEELKIWCNKMKKYPDIFNNKNFKHVQYLINNLEITNSILTNDLKKAKLLIKKIPYSFKKFKFFIALFLPNKLVKKFIKF